MIRSEEERRDSGQQLLELDLLIRKPPQAVKSWWTEFADDYGASDPREQPYRIVTKESSPNPNGGKELLTFWRNPDGSEWQAEETMFVSDDGLSWAFDVRNPKGFFIRDEFRAVPVEGGTRLEIRSKLTLTKPEAKAMIPAQKERMIQLWKNMVPIIERDASP